ncbi:hypothetical protein F7734_23545 [Scytonema sp. UIC 10036]|uniref:hypothetical protein n=1 Tax=Scytonema sp. UIC 10036 TaxID=2304196 RepID=UPI0012DAAC2D|nr:hypothetical protein [Scytonema sp. UIC 10036]MUG95168.1 hypothetical protein [Scytonema sp. UIC 10036]
MADININIFDLPGSELFKDSETFLDQLTEQELHDVQGGFTLTLGIPGFDIVGGLVSQIPTSNAVAQLTTVFFVNPAP